MTRAERNIQQLRIDYRDWCRFPKRVYQTNRVKPGCVWNWHGPVPVWADQTIPCPERVSCKGARR